MATLNSSNDFQYGTYGYWRHSVSLTFTQENSSNKSKITNIVVNLLNRDTSVNYPYGTANANLTIYKMVNGSWNQIYYKNNSVANNFGSNPSLNIINDNPNFDIEHDTDGVCELKITIETSMEGVSCPPNGTSTFYFKLPTIPRETKIDSITSTGLEEGIIINCNKNSVSFTDKVEIKVGDTIIKTIEDYTGGEVIEFTNDELLTIYNLQGESNEITLDITITTNDGTNDIGSSNTTSVVNATGTLYKYTNEAFKKGVPCIYRNGVFKKCVALVFRDGKFKRGI